MAKVIMVQGTMSNSGKSFLVAGLCRIFRQDGYRVAPFKSQNMALNSYITDEGLEMGRAQVMQAEAAGIKPMVCMNPILLKPTNNTGSQVIVNGRVLKNMPAREYFAYKKTLIPDIKKAFKKLEEYADIMEQVKCACDRMVEKGMEHPTIFEVETAMAFLYFYQKKCDYVLLEVGMGGRTDATNLIRKPVCSVITSVSMDHMQFLGNTLTEIAQAKAGIIKKDCPVVTILQKAEAMEAIKAEAEKQHARLYTADVSKVTVEIETLKEIRFDHPGLGTVTTRLTGTYQVENCCLAVTVLKDVLGIADQTILDGIQNTVWPGRFEVIGEQPLFIIDGAHNEDAALQLSASVEKYFTNIPITYIIGVLADKEHKKVLEAMLPYAGAAFTVTPDNPRAMKAEELASEAEAIVARLWKERAGKPEKVQGTENSPQGAGGMEPLPKVSACSSMKEAVQLALEHTKKDGVILAFGSLSYLKEIRQIMQSD